MATFTITTAQNIDALTGKTGGDLYNINGGTLTVDQDSRFGLNNNNSSATAATTFGNITISATLGGILDVDARFVRLIAYTGGSGTVPASNTVISQGGATGKLISVMSALTATPTASGGAMPATGFIKIKAWNSVAYASGALTGITAISSGVDTVGFIELVGNDAGTLNVPRLGLSRFRGEWYPLGTSNGVANQQFQIPTQGLAVRYFSGIYIEKTGGSNDYEFYPNAGSQTAVATDIRAKVCWITSGGLVRIGHNGTANAGYLPVTGLKVVIPNIFLQNCTAIARNANVLPNATLATRYDFTTTSGGVIEMDKVMSTWFLSFAQAFSVTLTNTSTLEQILVSEIASPMVWSKVGVGQTAAQSQVALLKSLCFAGGTFTDCVWSRATHAASGQYTAQITDVSGFTYASVRSVGLTIKANATSGNWLCTRAVSCVWTSPVLISGRMVFSTCTDVSVSNWAYVDVINGTTTTTAVQNSYVFELLANTLKFTSSGGSFLGLTNVQPYLGILVVNAAGCSQIKLRNIGTRAVPLSLGSVNNGAYLFVLATGGAVTDVKVQRCYVSNTRTGIWTGDNSSTRITIENVAGDYADNPVVPMLNTIAKGIGCTTPLTAQTAVYGSHFIDYFTSATVGRIGVLMNETTSLTTPQVTLASGANFTSAGRLFMPVIGMRATFEMPYFAIGHTGFTNTPLVMAGGTATNYTYRYQIDKNDGVGYSALSASLTATTLGTSLSGVTGINSANGVKLRLEITTGTTNATAITSVYLTTTTTAVAQDSQYPLDVNTLTLTGLIAGTQVDAYTGVQDGTGVNIGNTDNSSSTFVFTHSVGGSAGFITLVKEGYQTLTLFLTYSASDISIPIQQRSDPIFTP